MLVFAILGRGSSYADLERFRLPGVEFRFQPQDTELVLVFGGDGTVHDALPRISAARLPMLVVPCGSGNDFAHGLGIRSPAEAHALWKAFLTGANNLRGIDLAQISGAGACPVLFCNVAGLGLDANANRCGNRMPHWLRRRGGYTLAALLAVLSYRPRQIAFTFSDGRQQLSGWVMLAALGNGSSYGGGFRITPHARLDDGLLDLCFVRHMGRLRLLRIFPTVFSGKHLGLPEIDYQQSDALRLESDRPMDIYADGEFVCRTPAEVRVLPRAMKVVVPSGG